MDKRIAFRGMEHSVPLEQHAEHQLQRIITFLEKEQQPVYIDLVMTPSKVRAHHRVELLVKTPDYDRVVHHEAQDMYDALNNVTDVMYRKLHEDKQRLVDDRKQKGRHEEFKKQR